MTGPRATLFACGALLLAASAPAGEPVNPPEKLVYCTVCHGADMKGNAVIQAPRLSGMDRWYVERQLQAFRNGWRGVREDDIAGMEMRPMAAILTDAEVVQAAAYVAAASSPPPAATIAGDARRGETLYASCAACHGTAGQGRQELGGPALTGLDDWYLVTQLENFRSGIRGSSEGDAPGQQMRAAAALLAGDRDILDVVAYINTLTDE